MMCVYIRCQKYTHGTRRVIARTTARSYRSFNLYALSEDLQGSSTFATMELLTHVVISPRSFLLLVAPKGRSTSELLFGEHYVGSTRPSLWRFSNL
jgi:hypothetical protein